MTDDDDEDPTINEDLHKALADFFAKRPEGSMLSTFLIYAEVMNKDGEESVWIIPSQAMSLVTKMGISAYLVENFRGQLQHEE